MATNGIKKKMMIACVIILLIAVFVLIGVVIWLGINGKPNICLTRKCVKAAYEVFNKMDESVDPCDNFYEFACGNYMKNAHIPETEISTAVFKDIDKKLGMQIEKIVTNDEETDIPAYKKIKDLYKLCAKQIGTNDTTRRLFQKIDSYFKIKEVSTFDDLYEVLGKMGRYSKPFSDDVVSTNFPTLNIRANLTNTAQNVISVGDPLSVFSRIYFISNSTEYRKFREALLKTVKKYLQLINVDMDMEWTEDFMETTSNKIIDNWKYIANNTMPRVLRRDYSREINTKTLGELSQITPKLNWTLYVSRFLNKTVGPDYLVNVENEDFIRKIPELYENLDLKTEKAQILYGMAFKATKYLRTDYFDVKREFFKEVDGKSIDRSTWQICKYFPKNFNRRLAKEYLNMHFDEESRKEASNMISNIKKAFENQIMASTWMTEAVKKVAIEKAIAMEEYIGYTDDYLNETWVDMDLAEDGPLDNIVDILHNMAVYQGKERMNELYETEKKPPIFNPAQVNGFYSSTDNQILFPAGIMQHPLYDKDYPKYFNYGSIGAVIGHEISHGFDDRGRQRDKDGNVKAWWDEKSVNQYSERTKCFVDQYSQFKAPNKEKTPLNGKATLGENLADNAGVKQAFEGYKMWVQENGRPEPKLPGLKYTPEQIFFLKYSQTWCAVIQEKGWKNYMINAAHSPYMFRALGVLRNSKEFSEAFKCKLNSKMNPEKKCQLW